MIRGKTSSGFEYELEDDVFDDYELLEILRKIDKGESGCIVDMVDMLLGSKQKQCLKEHIRKENGKVSASKMLEEVMEIFQKEKEGKNF